MTPRALAGAVALAVLVAGAPARAQGSEAEARTAFTDAQAAEGRGDMKTACERYRASLTHLRAPGTLERVAHCDAAEGHHRDATAKLDEALGLLTSDNVEDRRAYEAKRATSKARLARLVISARPGTPVGAVTVDGAAAPPRADPYELDPGQHVVDADGVTRTITLQPGTNPAVVVPFAPPPTSPGGSSRDGTPDTAASESSPWLTAAVVSFAVGGAAVVATTITGVMALSSDGEAEELCGAGDAAGCDQAIQDTEALFAPNLALFIVSGVALGAGVTFVILDASSGDEDGRAGFELRVGPTAVRASGTF